MDLINFFSGDTIYKCRFPFKFVLGMAVNSFDVKFNRRLMRKSTKTY